MPEESLEAKAALLHSQPKKILEPKAQLCVCPLCPSHSPPLCRGLSDAASPPVPQGYPGLQHQDKSQLWAAGSRQERVTGSHTLREDFGNLFRQVCSIKGCPARLLFTHRVPVHVLPAVLQQETRLTKHDPAELGAGRSPLLILPCPRFCRLLHFALPAREGGSPGAMAFQSLPQIRTSAGRNSSEVARGRDIPKCWVLFWNSICSQLPAHQEAV